MPYVLWVSIYVCIEEKEEEMSYTTKDHPWSSVHRRVRSIQCTRKWRLRAGLVFTFDCLILGIAVLKDDDLEYFLYHVV